MLARILLICIFFVKHNVLPCMRKCILIHAFSLTCDSSAKDHNEVYKIALCSVNNKPSPVELFQRAGWHSTSFFPRFPVKLGSHYAERRCTARCVWISIVKWEWFAPTTSGTPIKPNGADSVSTQSSCAILGSQQHTVMMMMASTYCHLSRLCTLCLTMRGIICDYYFYFIFKGKHSTGYEELIMSY